MSDYSSWKVGNYDINNLATRKYQEVNQREIWYKKDIDKLENTFKDQYIPI